MTNQQLANNWQWEVRWAYAKRFMRLATLSAANTDWSGVRAYNALYNIDQLSDERDGGWIAQCGPEIVRDAQKRIIVYATWEAAMAAAEEAYRAQLQNELDELNEGDDDAAT